MTVAVFHLPHLLLSCICSHHPSQPDDDESNLGDIDDHEDDADAVDDDNDNILMTTMIMKIKQNITHKLAMTQRRQVKMMMKIDRLEFFLNVLRPGQGSSTSLQTLG